MAAAQMHILAMHDPPVQTTRTTVMSPTPYHTSANNPATRPSTSPYGPHNGYKKAYARKRLYQATSSLIVAIVAASLAIAVFFNLRYVNQQHPEVLLTFLVVSIGVSVVLAVFALFCFLEYKKARRLPAGSGGRMGRGLGVLVHSGMDEATAL